MLDKIEVGSKWKYVRDENQTDTVLDVKDDKVTLQAGEDGVRYTVMVDPFMHYWEPLPSPESPVDDVIWEHKPEGAYIGVKVHANGEVTEVAHSGAEKPYWRGTLLPAIAKAYADLYARLNPPLPPLPDGEWERVEVIGTGDIRGDESELVLSGKNWYCVDGDFYAGMAVGRGWVMRRVALEEWPKTGEMYWLASPATETWCLGLWWNGSDADKRYKERGLIFKTEEEAIAKAKNMVEGVGK